MRGALAILLILACVAGSADARRHRHMRYYEAMTPGENGSRAYAPPLDSTPADDPSARRAPSRAHLVPADWHEEPTTGPNGQRFVSPDGAASFAAYTVAAGEEGIAAHMKAVAFGDGEQVTYLRGERTWIAVAGFKQNRIFYRAAVLACGGDRWHHVAFEYPASAKAEMRDFVDRAVATVRGSDNSWCDVPVTSDQ
jgi:catechol 2,3-dioxygenase-like lactoylglutathione lyase family enzyme